MFNKAISTIGVLFFTATLLLAAPARPDARRMAKLVERNLDFAAEQAMLMYDSVKDMPGKLPDQTSVKGKFVVCSSHSWVSGFYPGLLWYIYEYTEDE